MARFIFFTKTPWTEPPRLRHQLARLLARAGHNVIFFEKARYAWQPVPTVQREEDRITVVAHRELLHHKLRLNGALQRANASVVKRSLRPLIEKFGTSDDIIVNFNYDYWFLREIFPQNRIVTIINDDFVSLALWGYQKPLLDALSRTCAESDHVLTVSPYLQAQLERYCTPQLFEPWSESMYRPPDLESCRDTLLFWGYINRKIDYDLVHKAADRLKVERPHIRLLFVGPVENRSSIAIKALSKCRNVEFRPPAALDDLPIDRVLAGFIPYRVNVPENDAISNPNKAIQMLGRGLPLVISGMPHFIRQPFVRRTDGTNITRTVDALVDEFADLQQSIEAYVKGHASAARLKQFVDLVGPL